MKDNIDSSHTLDPILCALDSTYLVSLDIKSLYTIIFHVETMQKQMSQNIWNNSI